MKDPCCLHPVRYKITNVILFIGNEAFNNLAKYQSPTTSKILLIHIQIIDYWLLFFLITTALNIAVHILIDMFFRKEKALAEKVVSTWKEQVRVGLYSFSVDN